MYVCMYVCACVRECMYVCMYVCMCECLCLCLCVCLRVMYVTTNAHKYHSLNNVTIGFLIFYFRQCNVRVFALQRPVQILLCHYEE